MNAQRDVTAESVSLISPRNRRWRLLATAFVVFNIAAVLADGSKFLFKNNPIQDFFYPYLKWTRLLQSWPLFTPEPRHFAIRYKAEIRFRKGGMETWSRPYPPNWDFFDRHLSYNFQKWDLATDTIERKPISQRDITNFLLRRFANPLNPPEVISFIKSRAEVPPPNPTGYVQHEGEPLRYRDQILWNYHVSEKRYE